MSFSQNDKNKKIHILETVIGKKNIQIEDQRYVKKK